AGKRVPGVSKDEPQVTGAAFLNDWLRQLNRLRFFLLPNGTEIVRASGHELGLMFNRNQSRVAFAVVWAGDSSPYPGFEHFVVEYEQLERAVLRFLAKTKALVLAAAGDHKTADTWWGFQTASSIDKVDDAWLND